MPAALVPLEVDAHLWERVFTVAPLVVVGTVEPDGRPDLAPKHMATPLGFAGHYGFVCTPRHATWRNAARTGGFTVSWPRPDDVVLTSLTAAPRCDDGSKPVAAVVPVVGATAIEGVLLRDAVLAIECRLERVVEGFGEHGLIVGEIVAAHAAADALRAMDVDEGELLLHHPPLAYLHPTRFAAVRDSHAFPYPTGFQR